MPTIQAIYEQGTFRPTVPVDLPEHTAVEFEPRLLGTEIVACVDPSKMPTKRPGTSLADWAEQNAEDWGQQVSSADVESFTGRRF